VNRRSRLPFVLGALAASAVLAACGATSHTSHSTTTASGPIIRTVPGPPATSTSQGGSSVVTVASTNLSPFGEILVNGEGGSLYIFERDRHSRVTCTAMCQDRWLPMSLPDHAKPQVTGQVRASLIGSVLSPTNGRVVTYAGWPLYTHILRASYSTFPEPPGGTAGQGLDSYGGRWYLISPSGAIITKSGLLAPGVSYPGGG
jgi:predicted lipoprotein with Yx(FWY)xxD motif